MTEREPHVMTLRNLHDDNTWLRLCLTDDSHLLFFLEVKGSPVLFLCSHIDVD